jgi:hypothetical protein
MLNDGAGSRNGLGLGTSGPVPNADDAAGVPVAGGATPEAPAPGAALDVPGASPLSNDELNGLFEDGAAPLSNSDEPRLGAVPLEPNDELAPDDEVPLEELPEESPDEGVPESELSWAMPGQTLQTPPAITKAIQGRLQVME